MPRVLRSGTLESYAALLDSKIREIGIEFLRKSERVAVVGLGERRLVDWHCSQGFAKGLGSFSEGVSSSF